MDDAKRVAPQIEDLSHDGDKIRRFRLEKTWSQAQMGKVLGVSCSTVKRVENQQAELTLADLVRWAEVLGVEARELLAEPFRHHMPSIELETFASEERFETFMLELERPGRIGIFNIFPSLVYQPGGGVFREQRRARLVSGGVPNIEYYSMVSVLNFGFSVCSPFTPEQKLGILDNMLAAFSEEGGQGHMLNQLNVVNTAGLGYRREVPDCEIINGTDTLVLAAPLHQYSALVVHSPLAAAIGGQLTRRSRHVLYTARSVKLLGVLRRCLERGLGPAEFVGLLLEQAGCESARAVAENLSPGWREGLAGR